MKKFICALLFAGCASSPIKQPPAMQPGIIGTWGAAIPAPAAERQRGDVQ